MKKGILIFCMAWGILPMLWAQDHLNNLDTIDDIDTLNIIDTANIIEIIDVTLIVDDMPNAIIHQDSTITQMMQDKRVGRIRGEQMKDGFRVQIYASNRQQIAKKESAELQQKIETQIDIPVYTLSEPPFWKVRVGNFKTREEANNYKTQLLQLFPELTGSTYVVPDKIIILQ